MTKNNNVPTLSFLLVYKTINLYGELFSYQLRKINGDFGLVSQEHVAGPAAQLGTADLGWKCLKAPVIGASTSPTDNFCDRAMGFQFHRSAALPSIYLHILACCVGLFSFLWLKYTDCL